MISNWCEARPSVSTTEGLLVLIKNVLSTNVVIQLAQKGEVKNVQLLLIKNVLRHLLGHCVQVILFKNVRSLDTQLFLIKNIYRGNVRMDTMSMRMSMQVLIKNVMDKLSMRMSMTNVRNQR